MTSYDRRDRKLIPRRGRGVLRIVHMSLFVVSKVQLSTRLFTKRSNAKNRLVASVCSERFGGDIQWREEHYGQRGRALASSATA
jgi:hypothetical protein